MPKKPCKARRLTERDLRGLDDAVEKYVMRLATRFGDCDGALERMVDDLMHDVRKWAGDVREYMDERESEGETWEL